MPVDPFEPSRFRCTRAQIRFMVMISRNPSHPTKPTFKAHVFQRNPRTLMINEDPALAPRAVGEPHSFGLRFYESAVPILPQAVGGILTQALWKAFVTMGPIPLSINNGFEHDYAEIIESKICFAVGVTVTPAANTTGIYRMTNRRVASVLELMGFDFAHHQDLSTLKEYSFDILYTDEEGQNTIGHGTLRNSQLGVRPTISSGGRVTWPRCSGMAPVAASRRSFVS